MSNTLVVMNRADYFYLATAAFARLRNEICLRNEVPEYALKTPVRSKAVWLYISQLLELYANCITIGVVILG